MTSRGLEQFFFDVENLGIVEEDKEFSITLKVEVEEENVSDLEEASEVHGLEVINTESDGAWKEDEVMATISN